MFQNISIQMIIDVLFAAAVIAVCLKALAVSSNDVDKRAGKWREELEALHLSLKDLISEAAVASNNLDRRLLQRKGELETLLSKIEVLQTKHSAAQVETATKSQAVELPNESWLKKANLRADASSDDDTAYTEYDQLVDQRKDKVTVSNLKQALVEQKIDERRKRKE